MARLGRLETSVAAMAADVGEIKRDVGEIKTAAWKTAEILADHSERLGAIQRTLDERLGAVTDRLDRLIAVTIQERTGRTERLGEIERRLSRLEERAVIGRRTRTMAQDEGWSEQAFAENLRRRKRRLWATGGSVTSAGLLALTGFVAGSNVSLLLASVAFVAAAISCFLLQQDGWVAETQEYHLRGKDYARSRQLALPLFFVFAALITVGFASGVR
jgi:hypothetical protein